MHPTHSFGNVFIFNTNTFEEHEVEPKKKKKTNSIFIMPKISLSSLLLKKVIALTFF